MPYTPFKELTLEDIEQFAERDHRIGLSNLRGIDSGSLGYEESRQSFIDNLDGLLEILEIDKAAWQDRIIGADGTTTDLLGAVGHNEYHVQDVNIQARGKSLGEFLLQVAHSATPIESDEEQIGNFNLDIKAKDSLQIKISADCYHEVLRNYFNTTTGEKLDGHEEDLEALAESGEARSTIVDVHTQLHFSASFIKVDGK